MKIHHLNVATMNPPFGGVFDGEPGLWRRAEMICHVLLIEHDRGLILVDTGLGERAVTDPAGWLSPGWVRLWKPRLDRDTTALAQVRALGYDPSDVRDIILTHMDLDHSGGAADFPAARIHLHRNEYEAFRVPHSIGEKHRYKPAHLEHRPQIHTYTGGEGGQWRGINAARELDGLPPEVLLLELAGHSRGHSGVAIDAGIRRYVHAGDAFSTAGQVDPGFRRHPWGMRAFDAFASENASARRASLDLVQGLAAQRVEVGCAHSAVLFRSACKSHAVLHQHSRN
ncbi:MBL fold metallo-hydrolase [Nocardia niigatensis]